MPQRWVEWRNPLGQLLESLNEMAQPEKELVTVRACSVLLVGGAWWNCSTVSGGASFVAVMQATDLAHRHDWTALGKLDRSWLG